MKAKIIMAIISFVLYELMCMLPYICSKIEERRLRKQEKMRKMETEAIDVEWCFA